MSDPDDNSLSLLTWIRQSSPYIRAHRGKTFVVHIPGEAAFTDAFVPLVHDLALLNAMGIHLVVCHGARPQIENLLQDKGRAGQYAQDMRVTDMQDMALVKQAASVVRYEIEGLFSMGLANSMMAGADIRVVSGNFIIARPLGVRDGVDFQYTGTVRRVDADGIRQQLHNGNIVVLSPLGYSPTGEIFNVTAEEITAATAKALKAEKAIFFNDWSTWPAVKGGLRELSLGDAKQELLHQTDRTTRHCLDLAIAACEGGVRRVHFLNHNHKGALLLELLTRDGSGMMISADLYEDLRDARIDDVGGILELIAPLEAKGVLVKRSRQKLESEIDRFSIMERDGMIIACAALYPFPDEKAAELACLAVHPDYFGTGRGQAMLNALEKKAQQLHIERLFLLTTQTAHWFVERGFVEKSVQDLPVRHQNTYNYKRNSKVLVKQLA